MRGFASLFQGLIHLGQPKQKVYYNLLLNYLLGGLVVVRVCVCMCVMEEHHGTAGLLEVRRQVLRSHFFPPTSMWDLEI